MSLVACGCWLSASFPLATGHRSLPRSGLYQGVPHQVNSLCRHYVGPDPRSGQLGRSGNGPYIFRPWQCCFMGAAPQSKRCHCEHPKGARQSQTKNQIASSFLLAMTPQNRSIQVQDSAVYPPSQKNPFHPLRRTVALHFKNQLSFRQLSGLHQ